MNITGLKRRIADAMAQPDSVGAMQRWLESRLPALHPSIRVENNQVETLYRFARAYIEQVPDVLEAAAAVAQAAHLRERMLPVLRVTARKLPGTPRWDGFIEEVEFATLM